MPALSLVIFVVKVAVEDTIHIEPDMLTVGAARSIARLLFFGWQFSSAAS